MKPSTDSSTFVIRILFLCLSLEKVRRLQNGLSGLGSAVYLFIKLLAPLPLEDYRLFRWNKLVFFSVIELRLRWGGWSQRPTCVLREFWSYSISAITDRKIDVFGIPLNEARGVLALKLDYLLAQLWDVQVKVGLAGEPGAVSNAGDGGWDTLDCTEACRVVKAHWRGSCVEPLVAMVLIWGGRILNSFDWPHFISITK